MIHVGPKFPHEIFNWENMRMRTRTHEKKTKKADRYWVQVIEIDDPTLPRRHPEMPCLKVSIRISQPTEEMVLKRTPVGEHHILHNGRGSAQGNSASTGNPGDPGNTSNLANLGNLGNLGPYVDKKLADAKKAQVIERLSAKGCTVNGNRAVWVVYVIELDTAHFSPAQKKKHRNFYYVGMTSKKIDARLAEHKEGLRTVKGPRFGRSAHKYFVRYRPDLSPSRVFFSQEQALRAESKKRLQLEARGNKVDGGTERLAAMKKIKDKNSPPT